MSVFIRLCDYKNVLYCLSILVDATLESFTYLQVKKDTGTVSKSKTSHLQYVD